MWKLLLENLWLKLGAIFLALLLWFYASTEKSFEFTLSYTMELVNLSPEIILAEPLPNEVKVRISGKGKDILKLLLTMEKSIKIEATNFSAGVRRFQVKKEMITIPEGLTLTVTEVVSPKVMIIDMQKVTEKKVPIISQLSFSTGEGYFIKGEVEFVPNKVIIRGPSESVEKTKFMLTQKKEYEGLTGSLSDRIDLIIPPSFNLNIFPQRVNFSLTVKKGTKTKLEKLPVEVVNLSPGIRGNLSPQTIDLELMGEDESILYLTIESVKVYIEGEGLGKGRFTVAPSVSLPKDVLLLKSEPDSFNLEIK